MAQGNGAPKLHYPVVIIGGGASGIAMGCCLIDQLKFEDFKIFDRQTGIGGKSNVPVGVK